MVIAAGGTGGHVMPALAVADALRARGAEVSFVGVRRAADDLVGVAGYPQDRLRVSGFARKLTLRNAIVAIQAVTATLGALRLLRKRRADLLLGAGGYVVGPAAVAAWLTRRPVVLMEADSHLGVANRLAAPLARRVMLAFPVAGRAGRRYRVTGRPVSGAVRAATRTAGRRAFGLDPQATVVLVVGGSQGARTLNRAAVEAFGDGPPFELLHVAGPGQVDGVRRQLEGRERGPTYHLFGYLDNLHDAIAAADLVVARAGGSVFELTAIGRPAILVPYPHAAGDHQAKNAEWLAGAEAAIVLADEECTGPALRELVGALLADRDKLEAMAWAARSLGRPDAADQVAEEVWDAVSGRARRRGRPRRQRRRRLLPRRR